MNIATPAFLWFPFAWNIFFHSLTFSLYIFLPLKWVSYRQRIYSLVFVSTFSGLFMLSFAIQKLVSLIRSHLFIFVFIYIALGDWPKKTLIRFMSENVLPLFSSKSFMASCLIFVFKPFWIYFYVWCEGVFWLHWLACSCPTFPTPLAEQTVFSPLYIFAEAFQIHKFSIRFYIRT